MDERERRRASLIEFLQAARTQGASDDLLANLLERRGWSRKEIYNAFGSLYEQLTRLEVRPAAARDRQNRRGMRFCTCSPSARLALGPAAWFPVVHADRRAFPRSGRAALISQSPDRNRGLAGEHYRRLSDIFADGGSRFEALGSARKARIWRAKVADLHGPPAGLGDCSDLVTFLSYFLPR